LHITKGWFFNSEINYPLMAETNPELGCFQKLYRYYQSPKSCLFR